MKFIRCLLNVYRRLCYELWYIVCGRKLLERVSVYTVPYESLRNKPKINAVPLKEYIE